MKKDITIIGNSVIDVLASNVSADVFQTGSSPAGKIKLSFGGDALNEAVVLSRFGKKVELISKTGQDEAGARILGFLGDAGISTDSMIVGPGVETSVNIVLVDEKGERHFLTNPMGSQRKLTERDVYPYIDYIFPNEEEIELLTGNSDPCTNAGLLVEAGVSCAVIKCGTRGCVIRTEKELFHIPAYIVENCVDTTGAGDSFAAGFLWALSEGLPLIDCGCLACATASCAVECVGATDGVVSLDATRNRYLEIIKKVK